jgi:hypothetical protein
MFSESVRFEINMSALERRARTGEELDAGLANWLRDELVKNAEKVLAEAEKRGILVTIK